MSVIRIAAVQLDYQPCVRTLTGSWRLDEPLSPSDPFQNVTQPDYLLSSLKTLSGCREVCDSLIKETGELYLDNISSKLREILDFCYSNKVDLIVFPEYAVPVRAIPALLQFSNKMTIIAGLGYLKRPDVTQLENMKFNTIGVTAGSNVAAVLSPQNNFLVTKKNPAQGESFVSGNGPKIEMLNLANRSITTGIAICLDFLTEKTLFIRENPDIVLIPALSRNIAEFNETPRGYIKIFANNAVYGGTHIGIPGLQGLGYTNQNGTIPLQKGIEGIVIVDWDSSQTFPETPRALRSTTHKLYAVANMIYSGREPLVAKSQKRMAQIISDDILRIDEVLQHASEYRINLDANKIEYSILSHSIETLLERQDSIQDDEILTLFRHCLLSEGILVSDEWRYNQCIQVAEKLKRLQERINEPEILAGPYAEYEKTAREIAKRVRVSMLQIRHKGPIVNEEASQNSDELQLVLFARLGTYSDESIKSLPRQLTMLRTIADLQDQSLKLHYRIYTEKDPTGMLLAFFEVLCTTQGKSQFEIELLREGLGQIIHIAFTGSYTITYTMDNETLLSVAGNVRRSVNWWTELHILPAVSSPYKVIPDWGMVVDLLRSLAEPVIIELQCSALPYEIPTPGLTSVKELAIPTDYVPKHDNTVKNIFTELFMEEGNDKRRLQLRIFIGSNIQLPLSVINSIGIEIAGSNPTKITESSDSIDAQQRFQSPKFSCTPVHALTIFHPPFGDVYATAKHGKNELRIPTDENLFPQGISLGKAHVRQVRADEEIEVKLSDDDRLRHTYIIGKTGSGKTNLLKSMASQDVQIPGRGVTIIDPHGDLVDHVLRQIPLSRANEVTLIDLSRTDALPILNPLDLSKSKGNLTIRDRTIQELILLLKSRINHQYTGPRFEEIVRLVFESMLDAGYPISPSFIEVPGILMDPSLQKDLESIIIDPELKKRWSFQETLARDNEHGSTIHWITSKFADISRDSTLRCVMGGASSTLNIEEIVNKGGILLVRIPEAVIGKQAADFIGSLILLQLRMAIIRRREFGKLQQHHFVYVDEFQNFANTDFHTVVAEARKFNIGFTLAHQNLEQLREFRNYTGVHEQRLINAILGNVGNIIIFGVGTIDAQFLSRQINVSDKDIMRIGRFQALVKILVNGYDSHAFTLKTKEAKRLESPRVVEIIQTRMMQTCWVNPTVVYEEIDKRLEKVSHAAKERKNKARSRDSTVKEDGKNPLDLLENLLKEAKHQNVKSTPNDESIKDDKINESVDQDIKSPVEMGDNKPIISTNKLEDINVFFMMGNAEISEEEKEDILDSLQQHVWEHFISYDVKLLLTVSEYNELEQILDRNDNPIDIQESAIDYLEKLIPDMEEILIEKALEIKEDLLRLRLSDLREKFIAQPDFLEIILKAENEINGEDISKAVEILNTIPNSSVDIKSSLKTIYNKRG